jgi:hypothetical protein
VWVAPTVTKPSCEVVEGQALDLAGHASIVAERATGSPRIFARLPRGPEAEPAEARGAPTASASRLYLHASRHDCVAALTATAAR